MDDDVITVCDKCEQASCWLGEFYCEQYKTAGIKKMTRRELASKSHEHPSYWKTDAEWTEIWNAEARKWNDERRAARHIRTQVSP